MKIKITRKQTNKLFENIAYDLYDKFVENADTIYNNLFLDEEIDNDLTVARKKSIRDRLLFEFNYIYLLMENKNAKKSTRSKKIKN